MVCSDSGSMIVRLSLSCRALARFSQVVVDNKAVAYREAASADCLEVHRLFADPVQRISLGNHDAQILTYLTRCTGKGVVPAKMVKSDHSPLSRTLALSVFGSLFKRKTDLDQCDDPVDWLIQDSTTRSV